MKTRILLSAVLALTLTLAACAPKAATPTKGTVSTVAPPVVTKPTATPMPAAKPTATSAPATVPTKQATAASAAAAKLPLISDLTINDQAVKSGSVLVSMVNAVKPGWVAVFTDDNGQPGILLGYTAVPAGTSSDVKVTIDAGKATDKMIAMLLTDEGEAGKFEYPGADMPVKNANVNTNVMAVFSQVKTGT